MNVVVTSSLAGPSYVDTVAASGPAPIGPTFLLVDTTGAVSIDLDSLDAASFYQLAIKDATGNANAQNITISATSLIDGAGSVTISADWGAVTLLRSGGTWYTIARN